jgi:hypothetical protein
LREVLASSQHLARRVEQIEAIQQEHAGLITIVFDEINDLKELPPDPPKRPIGFTPCPQ